MGSWAEFVHEANNLPDLFEARICYSFVKLINMSTVLIFYSFQNIDVVLVLARLIAARAFQYNF